MKKLKILGAVWLSVIGVSILLGAYGIYGTFAFAKSLSYFPLVLSLVFAANAFYGIPFYLIAAKNSRLDGKIIRALEKYGVSDTENVAASLGLREDYLKVRVEKLRARGYIK